ncbi:long-chain-fatty-acid--CoA ligase [Pseudomonas nicosulfuronedens]|uniref:Long-chain-fatty-acid--CoA ligase n=1 Tax=Pseudomonas nicosulfuronedens TaxID=2571105 RepID=A0A5R9QQF7_9PSED|nr:MULTISPECIES: long-chain-fatty-acid--CoA ligase [Pseudomonas]TLX71338.1 long-chain-fatty-acid--CoA ligase [Pseudomonas nicosulfuronedens]
MNTLGELLERNARLFPDQEAVVYEDRRITYRQLHERAQRLSSALHQRGMRHQDRVAILAMNCNEYFDVYTACHLSGFICATVNFRLAAPEIEFILQDSAPRVLVFEAQYAEVIESLRGSLPSVEHYLCIGECPAWAEPYDNALAGGDPQGAPLRATPDDIVHLIYTSGTTGRPKGAARSQRGDLALAQNQSATMDMRTNGRVLVMMPMFHAGGLSMMLSEFWHAGCVVLHRKFDAREVLRTIEHERIVTVHMAPTIVQQVLDLADIRDYDLSSLETILYAAAPMPVAVLQRGVELLGQIFVNSWGMTETTGTVLPRHLHKLQGSEEEVRRLGSIGQPMTFCEIRIVDEHGQDCPNGTAGEIWIRSPANMAFYWNNSVATLETLRDGWLRTGDMAWRDDQDFLFLVDRKKDMIISGGENIYCQEVEQALMHHPQVQDAAVIGVPHEKWGETVKAVVVLKGGATLPADELIEFCGTRIARYKRPTSIEFVAELPRLPSGKISKIALRQQYRS